jgi:acetoin utilization protein AcuC
MFESEARKVGSALLGAKILIDDPSLPVFSYSGGLHHGGPDLASGFCVFNDAAVAIAWLEKQGKRVAYVDIDVHHGDGVQAAFYETDRVLTISLHQDGRTLFPGTGFISEQGVGDGEGFSVNVPLPPLTDDNTYLYAFREIVPELLHRFEPDVLVTQLGVDTHFSDPLANMSLTTRGHEQLFRDFRQVNLPWLALGGGGYALDVVPRSWTLALAVMADSELPRDLPAGYVENYGGSSLRDESIEPSAQIRVEATVEQIVSQVKEVFELN